MTGTPLELRATLADRSLLSGLPGFSVAGLAGVLGGGYRARAAAVPGSAVSFGYRWRLADEWTGTWWPQGIAVGEHDGVPLALVSWYAQPRHGVEMGSRISVVDLRDPKRPSYRHVLLVSARRAGGATVLDPVLAHAGGIAWTGDRLLVAATFKGIREFRLGDILRSSSRRARPFGYEYVLPEFAHHMPVGTPATGAASVDRMRYSFLTVETGDTGDTGDTVSPRESELSLVVGEYSRDDGHRLARLRMAADRSLVSETHLPGISQMQGVALHNGAWYVSASRGETHGGDLWSGPVDALHRREGALPPGPEALAVWPARNELWSVSEVRGKRWIYAIPLAQAQ